MQSAEKLKLFIISDGRSRDKLDDIRLDSTIETFVLDSEKAAVKLNQAHDLAKYLKATYINLFSEQ